MTIPASPNRASTCLSLEDRIDRDFCDYLPRCLRQPIRTNIRARVLANTTSCKNSVHPPMSVWPSQSQQVMSLQRFISSISKQKELGKFPLYECVRLAKTLTIALLCYHSTPWAQVCWRSKDILFFAVDDKLSAIKPQCLAAPHVNGRIMGPKGTQLRSSSPPQSYPGVGNALLFGLEILLFGTAYASTWEDLRRPHILGYEQRDRYFEIVQTRRLA